MQATTVPARSRSTDRRLLFVALGLGALAALFTLVYLSNATRSAAAPAPQTVPMQAVVVAKMDIAAGEKITPSMVEVKSIPEAAIPASAMTALERVVDRTARYPVVRGEPITEARLLSTKTGDALSFAVPLGKRAVTFPINTTKSPAALLTPGDYVDILAIMPGANIDIATSAANTVVLALDDPVQVLAVQQYYIPKGEPYETSDRAAPQRNAAVGYLTVAVNPEDAVRLTWVVDQARALSVALRGFGDEQPKTVVSPFSGPLSPR